MATKTCKQPNCGFEMPVTATCCPHCGRPGLFPNVDMAELAEEKEALGARYQRAIAEAASRDVEGAARQFEQAVGRSMTVVANSVNEVMRLSKTDSELCITFYGLGNVRLTKGSHVFEGQKWQAIRPAVETALFGDKNKENIHHAALTLNTEGLHNYGQCHVVLRTPMIAHRTSVFHENSLVFVKKLGADYFHAESFPKGFRGNWESRAQLALAKLAERITSTTDEDDFPTLLMKQGKTTHDDDYIEAHVFGPMTVKTFERVTVFRRKRSPSKVVVRDLQSKLARQGVPCDVR